jgi:integrase
MKKTLTSKLVESVRPRMDRRVEIRDTLLPGFGLRISVNGKKSWFVVGRVDGRQIRHTVGTYPIIPLADARNAAREVLQQMQLGTYVVEEPEPPLTFEAAIRQFIDRYAKPKNRDWRRTASVLRKFESLNERPFAEIRRADVIRILDGMMEEGIPIRANRALAAIKKVFAWALDRGLIEVHPIAGLKPPGKEIKHDRILTDAEVRAFWDAAEALGYPFGPALLLFLITAQRRGEVTTMRWSNIDLTRAVWTIPGDIAKNGQVHEVPLSDLALGILRTLPRFAGSDLVFTTTGVTPISGFTRVKDRLDLAMGVSNWRFHDLRRTAASGMARLGVAPHVIEKVLNHISGQISGVAAIYNRHGYYAEKRAALQTWSQFILDEIKPFVVGHDRAARLDPFERSSAAALPGNLAA